MGSMTFRTFTLLNVTSFGGCNPQIFWSDDSRYLAAWQLTEYNRLRLLVFDVKERRVGSRYVDWFEIESFSVGKIKGNDSSQSNCRREIEIDVGDFRWQ